MELVRFSGQDAAAWDSVVEESRNGNFLHLRGYMDYHADRFSDHSLLVYSKGKPVAVFPANQDGQKIVSHGGLTYGGLIYSVAVHASDVLSIFTEIANYYEQNGFDSIIYKAIPHVFHRYPCEEDLYALSRQGASVFRRDLSSVVDIANRPRFSDSRKNTARKAEKIGVSVSVSDDLVAFHRLLSQVLEKFDARPVHSVEELQLLKSRFSDRITLHCAMLDQELLASALIYNFGQTVHVQYMASSEVGRKHGALDHLLITLLERVYCDKKYFSFGISTEEQGRVLNDGLARQKEGFGARAIVHDFYDWKLR